MSVMSGVSAPGRKVFGSPSPKQAALPTRRTVSCRAQQSKVSNILPFSSSWRAVHLCSSVSPSFGRLTSMCAAATSIISLHVYIHVIFLIITPNEVLGMEASRRESLEIIEFIIVDLQFKSALKSGQVWRDLASCRVSIWFQFESDMRSSFKFEVLRIGFERKS